MISLLPLAAHGRMLSAEEVVECGSLHDVSAYASSCPEPGAQPSTPAPGGSLGPPLLESLRLLGSPLHPCFPRGWASEQDRKNWSKQQQKQLLLASSAVGSIVDVTFHLSRLRLTKIHWERMGSGLNVCFPSTQNSYVEILSPNDDGNRRWPMGGKS